MMNTNMASAVQSVEALQDTGVPGHTPIKVLLDMAQPAQRVLKPRVLPAIRLGSDAEELEKLLNPHLETYSLEWNQMIDSDLPVDDLWTAWKRPS